MLQRSPILRFALEVLQHALESYCSGKERDKKMSVLHFAQVIELSVKATLVERNVSIYEKNGNRTITPHEGLGLLAKVWGLDRIEGQSRVELLIDERNAIQHRYGSVDDVTLDYHMQTAFDVLSKIMEDEFDTELSEWIKDNLDSKVWEKVRFVAGEGDAMQNPSDAALIDRSAALDFVDGFSRYERGIRSKFCELRGVPNFRGSTLDVMLKALSNVEAPDDKTIRALPGVYRLRNRIIHGDGQADTETVEAALKTLDAALGSLSTVPGSTLLKALSASEAGMRGVALSPDVPLSE